MTLEQEHLHTDRDGELPSTAGTENSSTATTPGQAENNDSPKPHDTAASEKPAPCDMDKPRTQNTTGTAVANGDIDNNPTAQVQKQTPGDPNAESGSTESADFVTPPDGGWGWFVVFSSFMIHVIADGIVYSFGVFLTELVDYFQAGRGEITWVGSLQPAITFTVGIGFGLIYLPAIVCVAQYFEKKRSFATGLAVCGSGFGTFVLAPVCKLLIEEYGWRGAMLLLGGFTLNIVVCGIIFRPLEEEVKDNEGKQKLALEEEELHLLVNGVEGKAAAGEGGNHSDTPKAFTAREGLEIISSLQELKALPKGTAKLVDSNTVATANDQTKTNEGDLYQKPRTMSEPSADHVPKVNVVPESSQPSETKAAVTNGNSSVAQLSTSQCLSPTRYDDESLNIALLARSDGALHHRLMVNAGTEGEAKGGRPGSRHASRTHLAPLQRKDIFYSGNLLNIPMYRSQPDIYHRQVASSSRSSSVDHRAMLSRSQLDEIHNLKERKAQTGLSGVWAELVLTLKDMMSMDLLKNPVFLMFGVSNFFTSIGFNMPFIFLPDRAEIAGIDKNRAALLLSVIGIANTVGRMVFGYLSDRPWVNRLILYNSALTVCGLATAFSPAAGGSYEMLVAYAAVFGLFIGVYVSLTSVVLVDLLGLELLTNSFGLLLLILGLCIYNQVTNFYLFFVHFHPGWLYDWTGSYDISFIVMGALIAFSGLMLFFLPPIQRWHQRRSTAVGLKHDADLGRHILQEKGPDKDVDIGMVDV
ncbi:hypothetical protein EGW08_001123, partial [Elysia chlorotica]